MNEISDRIKACCSDRYVIERELGSGGMATVYLAEDLKHHRKVAIKVMHEELSSTIGAERFLREIEIAAKLTHPHILPLHDSGEAAGLLYYVMPYIGGESLRERMARAQASEEGGMPVEEALQITREVAAALDHAHRHAIVHRDIKPENILLQDGVPIVADFGIARAVSAAGRETLTRAGWPLGTPLYMSPEQSIGRTDIDHRTDIYSLALVLYEMLIGEVPDSPAARRSIMKSTPSGHRRRLATLPYAVVQALAKALAEDPTDRFDTVEEFAAALTPTSARWRTHPHWRPPTVVGLVVVAVIGIAAAVWRATVSDAPSLAANRVLITTFENATGDTALEPLGTMVVDWLTRGLQETGMTQVIDARAVRSGAQEDSGEMTSADALRLASELSAGTVVSGEYYLQADSLRFQARVTETETGTVLYALDPVGGASDAPLEAVEVLRQRVAGAIASLLEEVWPTAVLNPPTYEAYEEYVTAIPMIGRQDIAGAIQHFLRAASIDTTFTMPMIYAAVLMAEADMFAEADSVRDVVSRSRGPLRGLERDMLGYLEARMQGDWTTGLAALSRIAEAAPLSEASWEVGQNLLRLNRPGETIDVLERLDPTRGFLETWWFYWNTLGAAHHMLGDYETELAVVRRGRAQFPDDAALARAELFPLAALGRIDEMNRRLDELRAMAPPVGRQPLMWPLTELARELWAHGRDDAARSVFDRLRRWDQGRVRGDASATLDRGHMAVAAYVAGEWDAAQREFQSLAEEFPDQPDYRGYLGTLAARRGDEEAARRISDWLANLERPYLYGADVVWQARIAALLGEPDRAMALLDAAFDGGLAFFGTSPFLWVSRLDLAWLHRDMDFASLRDRTDFQGLVRPRG